MPLTEFASTLITSVGMICAAVIYASIINHVRRKFLFYWNMSGSVAMMIVLGAYFLCLMMEYDMHRAAFLPTTAVTLFCFATTISNATLSLMRTEVLPSNVRAMGMGLTYAIMFLGGFVGCELHPIFAHYITYTATFWIYAVFGIICIIVVAFTLPETKDRSIDHHQVDGVSQ